ncbi:MAG: metalloregulator ArsR/SmtB family transcription factor [Treponema sp.]|nr:metalloregulator ArsR/SmtB family transcription factor [Treponema sp.]
MKEDYRPNIVVKEGDVSIYDRKPVLDALPSEDQLIDISELFKVFGDSTRMRILFALLERPLNVSEISDILEVSISAISHQLKILRANDLVSTSRDGKTITYTLSDFHVNQILKLGLEHINEK